MMLKFAGLVALFIIAKSVFDSIISAQFIIEFLLYKSLSLKLVTLLIEFLEHRR